MLVVASVLAWRLLRNLGRMPGCTVTAAAVADAPVEFSLSGEQADHAATIAASGIRLGMPDHAVTIWSQRSVADAAQLVQHSAAPYAYAPWEPLARAAAAALTGERPATLTCRSLTTSAPSASLGIDHVTFDGRTWTMDSGRWSQTGPADGVLSLHQAPSVA